MISKRSGEAEAPARLAEAGGAGRKPRTKRGGAELGTATSGRTKSEDHKLMEEVVERSNEYKVPNGSTKARPPANGAPPFAV
jgi:RNA-directed DNA polymerase